MELPRFMNRGLIEATVMDILRSVKVGLPRFMNRGLIEACDLQRHVDGREPELPRFMNRGLIEAEATR